MSDLIEKARQARAFMQLAGRYVPDNMAAEIPSFFDRWSEDQTYVRDDKRVCPLDGYLYKCTAAEGVVIGANSTWHPSVSPSIWVRIDDPAVEWPEWRQPLGGHNAYALGAKVSHKGKHWISNMAANVYEPGVYGWVEAQE